MSEAIVSQLLTSFHTNSWPAVESLAEALRTRSARQRPPVPLFRFEGSRRNPVSVPGETFLLRTSVEYANPQVTLEELQGVLLARLLEVSAPFARDHPGQRPQPRDLAEMKTRLGAPPKEGVVPFVLNVDDIEPDRYSVNPLRASIVASGQSARAVAEVRTQGFSLDPGFVEKYRGKLIGDLDLRVIEEELGTVTDGSYVDFVDRVKYRQLAEASQTLGIDLGVPALRMPLATLTAESSSGLLHRMISATHRDVATLRELYGLFGREFGRRKTLLPAVPHAPDKAASKRLARGKIIVNEERVERVEVRYGSGPLYPNEVDPEDVAHAAAQAAFSLEPSRFQEYDFAVTPASPQFAIYMLASPEDGAIWHGVGKYAGVQIVESYSAFHRAGHAGQPFFGVAVDGPADPPQWDLVAEGMLVHPKWGNIDASVGCLDDLATVLPQHTHLRPLVLPVADERSPGGK